MSFYITVNGTPACKSPHVQRMRPSPVCAHATKDEAREAAAVVKVANPDTQVSFVEGSCPAPRSEYDDGYEAGYATGLKT